MISKKIFCLIICGCFVFISGSCGKKEPQNNNAIIVLPEEEPVKYSFAAAEVSDVIKSINMRCTYKQIGGQDVSFSIPGRKIENVYVKEGDTVRKGQLLCELSVQDLEKKVKELEYKIARNELLAEYADSNLNVTISGYWVEFFTDTKMTESDQEKLDAKIKKAQQSTRYKIEDYNDTLAVQRMQMEECRAELAASRIYAGMDGVVYRLKNDLEGTLSEDGVVLMTIMDTSENLFEVKLPEYAEYFEEGEIVGMTIKSGTAQGDYEITPWHMEEWGDMLTFKVVSPADASFAAGSFGYVKKIVDSRQGVLNVPARAVKQADGGTYVYVLGAGDFREVRWVETGFYGDSSVEILSGLSEGEKVILK